MKEKFRFSSYLLTLSLISSSCSAQVEKPITTDKPSNSPITDIYHLPFHEPWFYNQAPHPAVPETDDKTLSSVDFGPPQVVTCDEHLEQPIQELEDATVISMSSGTVIFVGDKDRQSQTHSIVKIQNNDKTAFTYVHLDNINPKLQAGNKIFSGEILGTASCELPNDGKSKTTGAHVHVIYSEIKNGQEQTKSIIGQKFSGYLVKADGSMVREEETRIANAYRCDPPRVLTNPLCNNKRNDLNPAQPEIFPTDPPKKS